MTRRGETIPRMGKHTRTIRLRLTLLSGVVFLVIGGAMLIGGYLLAHHGILNQPESRQKTLDRILARFPKISRFEAQQITYFSYHQAGENAIHKLLEEFFGALLVTIVLSVAVGWVIAGRALRPLREITATARRVSGQNLGERIDLQGPNDELRELADTFDAMLARLDQTFASQRHFVANASHELRTPLAIMRTEVDVALANPEADVEELRAMGEAVRETVDRGEALVAALLQLARSEAVTGHEELVNMAELAADVITDLHRRADAAQIKVITDLQPAVAFGESALLERIISNLVDNGIRHNNHGGMLWVATSTVGPMTEIDVRSEGAVLDPSVVQGLTEPFRRLTRTAGGFGLGLSIVKSVAEAHGGTITLTARDEGGLQVKVQVPSAPHFQATALTRGHQLAKK